jgi:putative PEP-CTERM system histidine kinase
MIITTHFYRSRYDYREEWLKFAEGLSLKLNVDELVVTALNMLQEALAVQHASLWLRDRTGEKLRPAGVVSSREKDALTLNRRFCEGLIEKKAPVSIDASWAHGFVAENRTILSRFGAPLVVPLVSNRELIGVVFLGEKTTGEPFLSDDIDLLKSAGAQIASALVNAELSQELIKAKEMEMFHRFSGFVLHDLKNLVSNLSLVLRNAGEHMGNPEFRNDVLETIGRSVEKMENLIERLSRDSRSEKPRCHEEDLNELVSEAAGRIEQNGLRGRSIKIDLGDIPRVSVDREQMEKVVDNLILNAFDAIDNDGIITLKTEANGNEVVLSVSDNGVGMPQDFVEECLFQPFKSTKKRGLGIGLYQCKTIVEAHDGRIRVESEEGVGSTFQVVLPVVN